jgi:Adenylate and Guanylate cyclase catalytic domain
MLSRPLTSYMAVTGLPQPQPDHAVRMVKFARDCMSRMARLLDDLSIELGRDTRDLAMRVGLHRYDAFVLETWYSRVVPGTQVSIIPSQLLVGQ